MRQEKLASSIKANDELAGLILHNAIGLEDDSPFLPAVEGSQVVDDLLGAKVRVGNDLAVVEIVS